MICSGYFCLVRAFTNSQKQLQASLLRLSFTSKHLVLPEHAGNQLNKPTISSPIAAPGRVARGRIYEVLLIFTLYGLYPFSKRELIAKICFHI